MTDALLQTAVTTALGAGFTLAIDHSTNQRAVTLTRIATGATYGATHAIDADDAAWVRLVASLRRNHAVNEWLRLHGPWSTAQATAQGWTVNGGLASAVLPDGTTTIVGVTG